MSKKKTRPGYSELIEDLFLEIGYTPKHCRPPTEIIDGKLCEVRNDEETGAEWTSEPEPPDCSPIVARMAEALDAIVNDCVEADKALEIERFRGRQKAPYKRRLAWQIYSWKKQGDNWTIIEAAANEWLAQNGYNFKRNKKALEKIYKETGFRDLGPNFGNVKDLAKNRR